MRLANGDLVEVSVGERKIVGPAWIMPGQAPNTVALALGYGRQSGQIAKDLGYAAYRVRPVDDPWLAHGTLRRVPGRRALATSQLHHRMEGFDLVKEVSAKEPTLPAAAPQPSLYPPWPDTDYAWGMVIDLDRCIGCNACVAACNVENNVLVVGKDQVARGREMAWLRIDRYFTGEPSDPGAAFQPVPCMQCENAPCEQVCPVAATVHDAEGLNAMVYNRCIGTRYCSNNCPYKVRRFNFFNYTKDTPKVLKLANNPEVTVRSRGVMEKCTYCVQRLSAAKIDARLGGRELKDGDVKTACQQACPAEAIQFGDLLQLESRVRKARENDRTYALLADLNTRPRTTYQARLRNPHPALAREERDTEGEGHA
jgi:molybdopterin-containing oxidoreductase family iron-sulfur binding subunit